MIQLKDLCQKASSNIAQKDLEGHEGQYPIYGASGLIGYVDFYKQENPYVAVVKDGAGIGRVMCLPEKSSVIGTMQYILPNEGVNVHYLAFAMEHMNLAKYFSGATIPHIYFKDYGKEKLLERTEKEQKSIAEILNKMDSLISLRKQQIAKLDELVKARFVEMFGKASLLAQNQTKRLEECCISISGGNTPSMQHPEYYGGNIPFVKSGDVKGDYIVESTLTLTKTALTETTAKILPKSTLIVVIRSAALLKEFRIGMLMVDAVINQDLKALQVSEDFLPVYLMWAIKMQHQVLLNKVQTMLTSHIRMEDLLNLKIGTPPLSLQNQFAAFVERVDQQKQTVQQSLEKLELMKKALMQEYFG